MRNTYRTIEGRLLLFASFVLLLGFALVFLAKLPQLRTAGTANINTAPASDIADALGIDPALGKLIGEHRGSHGAFPSTYSLTDVRLLSDAQVRSLTDLNGRRDITALSPGQLSTRSGVPLAVCERVVESLALTGGQVTAKRLRAIPVVRFDTTVGADPRLRVREPGPVVLKFWVYAGLLLFGFLAVHRILGRRGPLADPFVLPCALMLAGLGAAAMFSVKDPLRDTDVYPRHAQGILLGLAALLIPLTAKYKQLRPWRYTYLYVIAAVSVIALLALFGTGPGGARLKLFGFQPVEVIKIALMFFVASYLADRWVLLQDKTPVPGKGVLSIPLFRDIGPLAVMYGLSLATFVLVRDLGPMLLLFGMFVALLYVATGRLAFIAVGVAAVALTGWIAYHLHLGVFDVRVDMWLHPWGNPHPNGMQLAQGLWGLSTGGLWGSGWGLGQPGQMPRSGSDLVFASLGEETGIIGSLGVLVLCGILVARGFRIALHARTDFARVLSAGVSILLGVQAVIILFGVLGLVPLTGVTFPFMSYGKSAMIASFFMVGLLLNASADGVRDTSLVRVETRRALGVLCTGIVALLLVVAGVGRLLWVQGVRADEYAGNTITTPDADGHSRPHINPRLRAIEASIPRGSIYDRNGKVLATSRDTELKELGLADEAEDRPRGRYYPYGRPFGHLVGYVDPRCGGPAGLEGSENGDLRGFEHYSALLPLYRRSHTPFKPEIKGKDIRLTVDAELQSTVEKALKKHAGAIRDRRTGRPKNKGAAVVLDVYTGEILAAASIPGFDPNDLTPSTWRAYNTGGKGESILLDRARQGIYPPGSTFKLVTAAAALENGVDLTHVCRHQEHKVRWRWDGKTYSRKRITDLEEMRAHGSTNLPKAIRVSCNLFFAHLGIEMGPEKLYGMTRRFRLRRIAPPKKLAEDLPDNAYGQGTIQVTPMEMARVVAAIGNNGVMMKPHFVKDVRLDGEVVRSFSPTEMGRPLSPETAAALRKAMREVTTVGTGRGVFRGLDVAVAGKTGSAENDQADKRPHSWFVGFAPAKDPRIAFAVVVENGGYGRDAAGPICREIVRAAL